MVFVPLLLMTRACPLHVRRAESGVLGVRKVAFPVRSGPDRSMAEDQAYPDGQRRASLKSSLARDPAELAVVEVLERLLDFRPRVQTNGPPMTTGWPIGSPR
jgi:hypothetical protein